MLIKLFLEPRVVTHEFQPYDHHLSRHLFRCGRWQHTGPGNRPNWHCLLGSIANLITIEGAKEYGVSIKERARLGVPITVASLIITIWALSF